MINFATPLYDEAYPQLGLKGIYYRIVSKPREPQALGIMNKTFYPSDRRQGRLYQNEFSIKGIQRL